MNRGHVYRTQVYLPARGIGASGGRLHDKYLIILQGGPNFQQETDVAVVIASTKRQPLRPFEVEVGPAEGFRHATVIDGRWVLTLPKSQVLAGTFEFALPASVMKDVSKCIAIGLQLVAPP